MTNPQPQRPRAPVPADQVTPDDKAGQVRLNGAISVWQSAPQPGPILGEGRWAGRLPRARAHVAVVVVYSRGDHQIVWPHERNRVLLHRRPVTVYEIDLGLHHTVIAAELASLGYAGSFHASISVQWRVFDPSAVVRHQVLNIEEALSPTLLHKVRGIARRFSIDQVTIAEDEINSQLGGVMMDVTAPTAIKQAMREATEHGCLGAEYGLWTRAITHLALDEAAVEHNTKMMKLRWAIEEEAEQRLRVIKDRNQQEITAERIAVYREIVAAGDAERFALRLARHPDEISAITAIIREDQLASRRDTIEFISNMVESGVVERWEVSDQVREALEWLKEATARVVTDKDHKGIEPDTAVHQRRRGRGRPMEEGTPPKSPPDVIRVTAEAVTLEEDGAASPPSDVITTKAEPALAEAPAQSAETTDLPPPAE